MVMITALLVAVVVVVAVAVSTGQASAPTSTGAARRVLDERLAAGEISTEEHARRSGVLLESHRQPARWRWVALAAGGVVVLASLGWILGWQAGPVWWGDHDRVMAEHMGWSTVDGTADPPVAGALETDVTATEMSFQPNTIVVTAGEPVNITLVNDGRVLHDLTIPALGFVLDAEPGEEVTGSLTVDEPGAYDFFCSVPGHNEAGMRGTLEVREADRA